jgi:aminoglycoside 3-N-acetyltransferase
MPSEGEVIATTATPATVRSLTADLRQLGLSGGDVVLVHSSLSALGWVVGDAQAVVEAVFAAVGETGTVVMPTHTGLSDPARWVNPPVPPEWVPSIRDEFPVYDPHLTMTRGMGQIVECFRRHPATIRSAHPMLSFAACGPRAAEIVGTHPLTPGVGDSSPLGRLYELDALVLLLGVDHANNTSMHLAEHRASWPGKSNYREGVPIMVDGTRQWVEYDDLDLYDEDFITIGRAFAETGRERMGTVGTGTARLIRQREVVDFAVEWMNANRSPESTPALGVVNEPSE